MPDWGGTSHEIEALLLRLDEKKEMELRILMGSAPCGCFVSESSGADEDAVDAASCIRHLLAVIKRHDAR